MRCRRRPQSEAQAKCAEETMKNSLLTVGVAATLIGAIGHPLIHVYGAFLC